MNIIKQNYFYILWKNNKYLAIAILIFCFFQAFFTYKKVETAPFFNYGMYSEPYPPKTIYSTISLYQDSKKISLFQEQKSYTFLQYQLNYYSKLLQQDSINTIQKTIESRFGANSNISKYLIDNITSPPCSLKAFPEILKKWTSKEIKIFQENYEWVNNNFKKVTKKQLY